MRQNERFRFAPRERADPQSACSETSKGGTSAGLIDTSALLARSSSADLGYYGAFVLDPDGHNIEAVNHLPE
jgi:hypothetical protein